MNSDPLSERDERKLVKHVLGEIDRYCEQIVTAGFDRVIGTSGTILSMGAVAATAARGAPPSELRNLHVSAKQIRRLRKEVTALDLEQRSRIPGLDPRRADLVVAGAVLLDTILRRLGADELTLCDLALREGLVLDYIRRNRRADRADRQHPRRAAPQHARSWPSGATTTPSTPTTSCAWRSRSSTRRARVHGLTDREREWLEYAALMHDIGGHISYSGHHKHSYYLIKNGDLRGFHPDEIEVMALVARYHRRGTPRRSHDEYAQLSGSLRRTVKRLPRSCAWRKASTAAMRSRFPGSKSATAARIIVISLHAAGDAELEVWATARHLEPFEELVGKRPPGNGEGSRVGTRVS